MTDPRSAADSWLGQVEESTGRLLRTVAGLKPDAVAEPSALPGWTKGHVLAHLARNADSLVNLLTGARTGTDVPQYASHEARDQDIERDAPRPLDAHLADLRASHERFLAAAAQLTDDAWAASVKHRFGYVFPAHQIPHKRLLELEYHHVDLAAGHTPADWPEDFAVAQFRKLAAGLAGEAGLPAVELVADDTDDRAVIGTGEPALTVRGPVRALTAWLSGRSAGDALHRTPDTALPPLPPMG
ncbi:maleylpyruvate isomerase family mycothiol-dependent enzyme [Kitasatospora xanthocidica]|uniref:Maleylpyruvate isomerase family mycothiol-dependent enzyme n=1 Tax=Kitasatospora xanthocidica TaxID=83382 RepID=A0A373A149_9ACTN|nr:maleylpyruvate isomerase family mycothiol-dependent enzyme [Kitasatospora xanthocidica]RGD61791.1 maleylpyruvate isomerase family mycothiol-dependent enzyme [Kitasatospora xanthocidica]